MYHFFHINLNLQTEDNLLVFILNTIIIQTVQYDSQNHDFFLFAVIFYTVFSWYFAEVETQVYSSLQLAFLLSSKLKHRFANLQLLRIQKSEINTFLCGSGASKEIMRVRDTDSKNQVQGELIFSASQNIFFVFSISQRSLIA
jgi:hypothetical protein